MGKKMLNVAYLNGAEGMIRRGASSGGSGSGESSEDSSSIEYLDVSGIDSDAYEIAIMFAVIAKKERNIAPIMYAMGLGSETGKASAIGIDFNLKCSFDGMGEMTVRECIELGGFAEIADAIPRITKEEFYSLE